MTFDENYFLIEDSCSAITRFARFNGKDRKFFGSFHDVSRNNPDVVAAQGNYSSDGILDGPFISRYLDGQLQAEGTFSHGKMIGKWTLNYPNNIKRLEFENINGITHILNAWDESGKQTVVNGQGNFTANMGRVNWAGKIVGGLPDGLWKFTNLDDRTGVMRVSETFKNTSFVKGTSPSGSYHDQSRLTLTDVSMLPINNAAVMRISATSCDPTIASRKKIVYAIYKKGREEFTQQVLRVSQPVIAKIDLKNYSNKEFNIEGMVSAKGEIVKLKYVNTFDDRMSRQLLESLYALPFLEPTLIDGVATASGIRFTFVVGNGAYSIRWQMLPVPK